VRAGAVHLHARFGVRREREPGMNHLAQPANLVRQQKGGVPPPKWSWTTLRFGFSKGFIKVHLPFEIVQVFAALFLVA